MTAEPPTASRRLLEWGRAHAGWLIGLIIAAIAVELFYWSGTASSTNDTLQVMGFDPDRASLLTAFIATAMAAAIMALAGAPTALGVLAALLAGTRGFWHTALSETRAALNSSGTQGTFDPLGWVISIATFVIAFAAAGWAAAILAREARQRVLAAFATIRERLRRRDRAMPRSRLAVATGVLLSVVVVAASLPVLGDMLNYDPDVHMRQDAASVPGLFDASSGAGGAVGGGSTGAAPGTDAAGGTASTPAGGAGSPVVAADYPTGLVTGPLAGSLVTPGAVSTARPWSTSLATGHGRVMSTTLPAPWTGGIRSSIGFDVYLPPGYDAGSARYPVIYEAPDSIATWQHGMRLPSVLDALITSGSMPPTIVVFVSDFGGPYADSECADTYDGTEWVDRFVATDLVHWVDTNLRTIASPAARATFGFSVGGYCAAAIMTQHPDVFGSSIVLSGYFVSGIRSGTTPNAWRPFNNNPALIAATSPMTVVPRIPTATAAHLFVVMAADPTQGFYGPQMAKFASVLHAAGIPMAIFPTPLGHSWDAASQFVPTMLELLGGRMATLGVFGPTQ